ncbi:hypothetical protein FSP39_004126 [Pinctada imbricata]|uniref:C1q domain-containing protein n=1 Tax=Pinctada imbricata TaxID=66713 RepID=A0AA89BYE9_PINIB|nr:hypothetical protein FSP39_004126 [Pinctada imbricata]
MLGRLEHLHAEVQRLRASEAKVTDLQSEVKTLKSEVQTLELRLQNSESNVQSLESRLRSSESKLQSLLGSRLQGSEAKIQTLASNVQYSKLENKALQKELNNTKSFGPSNPKKDNVKKNILDTKIRGKRLIGSDIIPQLVPSATAFSAVITSKFDRNIGGLHVFVYDHVECNLGGSYNNITGIFTAPRSGVFAFLWTIVAEGNSNGDSNFGEIGTELLVNSQPKGRANTDTEVASDDDQATGFVIVQLNQGDVVYVRSVKGGAQGVLQKYTQGGWTFSGWQIA